MIRKPSPKAVRGAVSRAVHGAVSRAVSRALDWPVFVAVDRAIWWGVHGDVAVAVRRQPPHPNIDLFMAGVRQTRARWGAA